MKNVGLDENRFKNELFHKIMGVECFKFFPLQICLMAFDDFFKNVLKELFGSAVESGVSISTLEKRIDLIIHGTDPQIQQSNLLPFFKQTPIHVIEFKSHRDTYTPKDLSKLLGYGAFYAENKGMDPDQFQENIALWFIVTTGSPELNTFLKRPSLSATEYPGIYRMRWTNPFYIVIINELEITEQTGIFLMNSSGAKLSEYVDAIMQHRVPLAPRLHRFLRTKLLLDYSSVKNMTEASEFFALDIKDNIRAAIQDIGLEKVIEAVGLEKVIKAVGLEKVIKAVGLEKVVDAVGLDKLLETVDIEKIEKYLQKKKKKQPSK
jgi:hypothetical protein